MRGRGAATIVAGALALAGCGGSSKSSSHSSSTASTSSTPAASHRVSGRDGGFSTVIPTGFTDSTSTATANNPSSNIQLAVTSPPANGFATNLNVIRSPSPDTDVSTLTDEELAQVRKGVPSAHGFSKVSSTTVAGQQARVLDYLAAPVNKVLLHIRQVIVIDNSYAYTITYSALPSAYSSELGALNQMVGSWQWS